MEKQAKLTWRQSEIIGVFYMQTVQRGEKWIYGHFPDMESRAHQDSIMIYSRIGWTLFPSLPLDCFSSVWGERNGKRRGYDLCHDGCQHKLGSYFFFSPPFKGLLYKKIYYTFTTSKEHVNVCRVRFMEMR